MKRLAVLFATAFAMTAPAATLPPGFTETSLTASLGSGTAMALAPDGRIFVTEQGGKLRVIKNRTLLVQPFLTVTVDSTLDHGLLGVVFDPGFATNQFLYIYYTATTPAIHNRISRFTANGDVAVAGSELVLFEMENLVLNKFHSGGPPQFGPDGKLYIGIGDDGTGTNSQTLANLNGKILRINTDGTIPTDNPFYATATGKNRAIWAMGLRNPFMLAFQSGTGRLFINDVGEGSWEEINDGRAGANYGWPVIEGESTNPNFVNPLLAYGHGSGPTLGCAITGGAFYNPGTVRFPSNYVGKYFFSDFCSGWIRVYDPATDTATDFASGAANLVSVLVSSSGKLYYLNTVSVMEVDFTATLPQQQPQITTQPQSQTVSPGSPATFSIVASGAPTLTYQWKRNSVDIFGATAASYMVSSVTAADSGAQFLCVVTNTFGTASSNPATLTVTSNSGGLIGYWGFDEGSGSIARDTSGSGYNGIVSAAAWTAGKVNSALSFNGAASGVTTPGVLLDNTLSISAWVNPAVMTQTAYSRIAETQYDRGFFLGMNAFGTAYKFIVYGGLGATGTCGAGYGCAEGGTVTAGWHLVTATFDGSKGRLYLDGALVATDTFTAPLNTNYPLNIGHYFAANGFGWNGVIDEVRLYNRALSAAEIAQLYNPTGGGQSLTGFWRFDEGSGSIAKDTSGSGYDGTVSGATWTAGKVSSALSFNGAASGVTTPGVLLGSTLSISVWLNPAVMTQTAYSRIAETQYDRGFYLGMNSLGTAYKFIVNGGLGGTTACGAWYGCAEGGSVTAGWHLVTATFDGSKGKLYVDGTLVATDTFTAPVNTNYSLNIGRYFAGNGFGWKGAIDEVRLYKVALSAAEVAALFNIP